MPFVANKISVEPDAFGLGLLYEVEFTDGTTTHRYLKLGRSVQVGANPPVFIATTPTDVRLRCPNDRVFVKACKDHCAQFDATAAGSQVPDGAVDLTQFDPQPPQPPTKEQQDLAAFQAADREYQAAQGLFTTLKNADPAAAMDLDAKLADMKAARDALAKAVIDAVKAETVAVVVPPVVRP